MTIPSKLHTNLRSLDEIKHLIEIYPESWRHWCSGPEEGGCACMGCVRHPAPSTVRGDPEHVGWFNEIDALTQEEVALYWGKDGQLQRHLHTYKGTL